MGLKDINLNNIDFKKENDKHDKEKLKKLREEEEEQKKRWIEKWGEEHWNETEKTVEKMANRIMEWNKKNKK